jgi:hypothetical protein
MNKLEDQNHVRKQSKMIKKAGDEFFEFEDS